MIRALQVVMAGDQWRDATDVPELVAPLENEEQGHSFAAQDLQRSLDGKGTPLLPRTDGV
jgi:hypothetical protein